MGRHVHIVDPGRKMIKDNNNGRIVLNHMRILGSMQLDGLRSGVRANPIDGFSPEESASLLSEKPVKGRGEPSQQQNHFAAGICLALLFSG
jgi:hypothetical protein